MGWPVHGESLNAGPSPALRGRGNAFLTLLSSTATTPFMKTM